MAEWETPKTDWYGATSSDGTYEGDRFNAEDFNRIKNNLDYLRDLAVTLYEEFDLETVSDDKGVGDYFYADEINQMEENLETLNENTLQLDYGDSTEYTENGLIMDYTELNRLESAILDLYDRLTNMYSGRRMFTWSFGTEGGSL